MAGPSPAAAPVAGAPVAPAAPPEQPVIRVSGILDIDLQRGGNGQLLDIAKGGKRRPSDPFVPKELIRRFKLRAGSLIGGTAFPPDGRFPNPKMKFIETVDGQDIDARRHLLDFNSLTTVSPNQHLRMELKDGRMTTRAVDLFCPIGKGTRGLIVAPPRTGKTTLLRDMALGVLENNPECIVMILLVDERPEEVTDMRRHVLRGEVVASTFDRPSDEHTHVAEVAIERAKRLVELGKDVVIVLDGITRLARAYNLAAPASGRIMSGGIDAGALYPPKKFFGAARNCEEGGSLTILATALVDTNSRMDDAIFEEFKGTGNMELRLDRRLAERRVYPAIDVDGSSTRHEELLFERKRLQQVWKLRRVLSGLAAEGNPAAGLELLTDRLKGFRLNDQFLDEIGRQ